MCSASAAASAKLKESLTPTQRPNDSKHARAASSNAGFREIRTRMAGAVRGRSSLSALVAELACHAGGRGFESACNLRPDSS
jgi:hypothetical protein